MNIRELQKLDFLLKKINSHSKSKEFNIVFSINNELYTGDFIPTIIDNKVQLKDVSSLDSSDTINIDIKNFDDWVKITDSPDKNGIFDSDYTKLIKRSNFLQSSEYLRLLDEMLIKYPIEFENPLPTYIYNIKLLNNKLPINFMKIDEDTQFDFVSLVPENAN
ncbi:hypothetical protein ACO1B2_08205 [Staphylococcus saprophyticus]|uniref:hypothetical protein n=1 Tax=Staphylococcus saprophyticus TaxID=29385 RepID=UPI0029757ACC|nr:hypothetical protein [Staphylococcus saprophyticus]